ncbi:MAG: hypothetical protein GY913_22120 [Proteobacteria bacterium]|nr:hypothetical protein [Pseudomonadota bacterium]MCP4919608.1 hypothetical protein [Pseudomonadota bacterium]
MFLLLACVRTAYVGDSTDNTGPLDSAADSATDSAETCPLAVPAAQTLTAPVAGEPSFPFALPSSSWALATAHAARQVEASGSRPLPASYWLALGMERTLLSCGEYGDPWSSASTSQGCMELYQDIHWVQLDRLHPDWFVYAEFADQISPAEDDDKAVAGVHAAAWQLTAILPVVEHDDLGGWIDAADDVAWYELAAIVHVHTPWSHYVPDALACPDDPGGCSGAPDAEDIGALAAELHASTTEACYDEPLTAADIEAYVAALEVLWPTLDWESTRDALPAAGTFQDTAPAVLDAIDTHAGVRLHCPGPELSSFYGVDCL